MRARPLSEYLEDQPRPVDDFGLPPPFEVALLDGAQRPVNNDQLDIVFSDPLAEAVERAAAEKGARARVRNVRDLGADHVEANRLGQPNRLLQASLGGTAGKLNSVPPWRGLSHRMDDEGPTDRSPVDRKEFRAVQGSAISLFCSNSWIGCAGITVEIACLYTS